MAEMVHLNYFVNAEAESVAVSKPEKIKIQKRILTITIGYRVR